jgi:hypothetical protein
METTKSEYDVSSAITFLLIGLGLGLVLTILSGPRTEPGYGPEESNGWRTRRSEGAIASQSAQVRM